MTWATMAAAWTVGWAGVPSALPAPIPLPAPALTPEVLLGVSLPGESCPPAAPGWTLSSPRPIPFDRFCEYVEGGATILVSSPPEPNPCTDDGTCGPVDGLSDANRGLIQPQANPPGGGDRGGGSSGGGSDDGASGGWDTDVSAAMASDLWTSFLRQIDAPGAPLAALSAVRPTLAVVDTLAPNATNPPSQHGLTLRDLANHLTERPAGPSAVDVRPYLGLPRLAGGVMDAANGGHYGSLWDVAEAIVEAVDDARAAGQSRLVINLSLGWDPTGQPSLPTSHLSLIQGGSSLPAPIRAVHAALVFARCSGALIYAASGNDDLGLGDRTGPLLPAGWSPLSAPTATECAGLWGGAASVGALPGTPLVYPVGGLGNDDERVPNARKSSTPVLVAAGEGVPPPSPGRILTGTSISTLVASTAAALVWGIDGAARADDVHARVMASARTLPWSAEVCPGHRACPAARAVSVCAAQRDACLAQSGGPACPAPTCASPSAHSWPFSMFLAGGLTALRQSGRAVSVAFASETKVPGCGAVRLPVGFSGPAAPCPTDEVPAARSLDASPQPVDPMCPACFVDVSLPVVTFVMDIVPSVPGGWLREPFVVISDGQGSSVKYGLPGPIPEGSTGVLQFTPGVPSWPVVEAWLQYQVDAPGGPFSLAEPLIVE